jgi:hypothetical protein
VTRALVAIAVLLAFAPPAEASRGCRPHGSKTLRATKTARAYQLHGRVYACLHKRGERYRLGVNDLHGGFGGDYVDPIRLRGPFVGFARQWYDHYEATDATVAVKDLRDGRVVHAFSQSGQGLYVCDGAPPPYTVTDLALAPTGGVAWIASVGYCDGEREKVTTMASRRPLEVLDDSSAVGAESLFYAGGSIFWDSGGEQRSAPLR